MLNTMLTMLGLLPALLATSDPQGGQEPGEGNEPQGGQEPQGGGQEPEPGGQPQEPQAGQLEQDARTAIQQLKDAGQEIPQALEKAVSELSDARKEAASYRNGRNELRQEFENLKTEMAKALGVDTGDNPPDPQQLQQTVADRDAKLQSKTVELAAYKSASKHDADADALLDSRSFLDQASQLDPDADDFQEKLDAAIKASVEANPKLKAAPGGGQNGPRQGPQPQGSEGPKDLKSALAEKLSPQ